MVLDGWIAQLTCIWWDWIDEANISGIYMKWKKIILLFKFLWHTTTLLFLLLFLLMVVLYTVQCILYKSNEIGFRFSSGNEYTNYMCMYLCIYVSVSNEQGGISTFDTSDYLFFFCGLTKKIYYLRRTTT